MGYFDFYHNELSDQQIDELHGIMAIHEAAGMPPFQAALQAAKDKLQQAREYRAEIHGLILEAANKKTVNIKRLNGGVPYYEDICPACGSTDIMGTRGLTSDRRCKTCNQWWYYLDGKIELGEASQMYQLARITESALSDKIDAGAHQAATSPKNNKPEPTPAQQAAGNYAKGSVYLYGLEIAIENPEGSTRKGVSPDGKAWESRMYHHYGYIRRTEAIDGDAIDVFLGSFPESDKVFVVDQVNPDGKFDEHKVMLAFRTLKDARKGYLKNYEEGWQGLGSITEMSVDEFKEWLKDGDTLKPVDGAILEAALNIEVKPIFESAGKVVMVLAGDEVDGYVPVKMPNKRPAVDQLTLRDRAEGYYKDHFQGKDAHRPDLSTPIRISNKGLDELFIHYSSNPDKLRLVPAIKAIIEHGEYEGREPISHPRQKDRIVAFHLISANVVLNGKTMNVRIELGEDQHGHLFYDLFPDKESHDMKRKSRIRGVESESTGNAAYVGRIDPSHNSTLPLPTDAVKPVLEGAGDEKESWQMTKTEWNSFYIQQWNQTYSRKMNVHDSEYADWLHMDNVDQAIKQGKPVPDDVLKDYPDLAKHTYDYRSAIERATTFEDIQAVFTRVFPGQVGAIKKNTRIFHDEEFNAKLNRLTELEGKKIEQMTREEFSDAAWGGDSIDVGTLPRKYYEENNLLDPTTGKYNPKLASPEDEANFTRFDALTERKLNLRDRVLNDMVDIFMKLGSYTAGQAKRQADIMLDRPELFHDQYMKYLNAK